MAAVALFFDLPGRTIKSCKLRQTLGDGIWTRYPIHGSIGDHMAGGRSTAAAGSKADTSSVSSTSSQLNERIPSGFHSERHVMLTARRAPTSRRFGVIRARNLEIDCR